MNVALIYGRTGPLEAYAKQTEAGLRLGFEYATKGSMEVDGRKINIILKDDQSKPDLAKTALAEAYEDDHADIAIGTSSSAAAIAMLPVAEEHKKILIVEPAVADQITGDKWNRYIFRTGRNSSQDAISNAVAIGKPGVTVATLGAGLRLRPRRRRRLQGSARQDRRDPGGRGICARQHDRFHRLGTAPVRCAEGQARPQDHLGDLGGRRQSARQIAGSRSRPLWHRNFDAAATSFPRSPPINAFPAWKAPPIIITACPKNPINDWLVAEHQKRFNAPPDFFTAGGFSAAMAVVAAVEKAKSTDTEELIAAMEGMEFDTPKGKMIFRKEDHQALQSMYHFQDQGRSRARLGGARTRATS